MGYDLQIIGNRGRNKTVHNGNAHDWRSSKVTNGDSRSISISIRIILVLVVGIFRF